MIRFTKKVLTSISEMTDLNQLKELYVIASNQSHKYEFDYCNMIQAEKFSNICKLISNRIMSFTPYKVGQRIAILRGEFTQYHTITKIDVNYPCIEFGRYTIDFTVSCIEYYRLDRNYNSIITKFDKITIKEEVK
jgi:hypothetical protein